MAIWLYARYGGEYMDHYDSLEEAIGASQGSSEYGEAYTISIYHEGKLYIPDIESLLHSSQAWRQVKTKKMLELDEDFSSVESFPTFLD